MSKDLNNLQVLVTRPVHQAKTLCEKIQHLNGTPILFPTIEIVEIGDKEPIQTIIKKLSSFDLAIFVSVNAVEKFIPFLQGDWPAATEIAAIGVSTAATLKKFNLPVTFFPKKEFNTEGLLALPELQNLTNKNIVIFKGEHGRDLLHTVLCQRGAKVTEVVVYQRKKPTSSAFLFNDIDVIVCTSNAGLQNLYDMLSNDRHILLQKPLLVISQRMKALAQNLGFVKLPQLADNATDAAIIAALIRFSGERTNGRRNTT